MNSTCTCPHAHLMYPSLSLDSSLAVLSRRGSSAIANTTTWSGVASDTHASISRPAGGVPVRR